MGNIVLKKDLCMKDEAGYGVHPTFVPLTLNPSPKAGEGLPIRLPFSRFGRRGWRMRANLQNWDAP
jgi:hypothetical protein